tara:strand:+ start:947 stop:1684 length:738 start_codon:yes stop_codon:yes gene_type:complete
MFFNQNKKVEVTFITSYKGHFDNDKPTIKVDTPYWHKGLKTEVLSHDPKSNTDFEIGTIKGCPGISNLISEGIKIKSWEQLKVRIHPDGRVEQLPIGVDFNNSPFVQHPPVQYPGLYPKNATAFKMNNPWLMLCDEPIKFIFMESHYLTNFFRENNLYIAPGFIDFKYQHSLNCHIIAPTDKEPYDIEIPYHTPLFTLYPMTDKKIVPKYRQVHPDEMADLTNKFPKCPVRKYYQLIKNLGEKVP